MAEALVKLMTPKFRVSFPQVWHKKAFTEGGAGRYSLTALFTPAEFSVGDKAVWAALTGACNAVALKNWKKSYKDAAAAGGYVLPFHKGDAEGKWGRGPGVVYCTLACVIKRPGIVDRNLVPLTEDDDEFYSGCYARASVNPYVPMGWKKTMAIGLNNLQKLADGERLDSFSSAEDDFGSNPGEYGSDFGAETETETEAEDDFGV
jgi:hypothetical protein